MMKKIFLNGLKIQTKLNSVILMWNGEGVDDDHPLRNLEDDDD